MGLPQAGVYHFNLNYLARIWSHCMHFDIITIMLQLLHLTSALTVISSQAQVYTCTTAGVRCLSDCAGYETLAQATTGALAIRL